MQLHNLYKYSHLIWVQTHENVWKQMKTGEKVWKREGSEGERGQHIFLLLVNQKKSIIQFGFYSSSAENWISQRVHIVVTIK